MPESVEYIGSSAYSTFEDGRLSTKWVCTLKGRYHRINPETGETSCGFTGKAFPAERPDGVVKTQVCDNCKTESVL